MSEELIIIDNIKDVAYFQRPYRLDYMLISMVEQGNIHGKADLLSFQATAPSLVFLFPNELIEYQEASDDLLIKVIVMSKTYSKSLQTNESFSAFFRLKDNPIVELNQNELDIVKSFYHLLATINDSENDGKHRAIEQLFLTFFHLVSNMEGYKKAINVEKTMYEKVFERFHAEIVAHYKDSREVKYYADKLCMAPKYMAKIIKGISGKPATQWINEYVILEAKSLLLSNYDKTLLEISEELGFPNQSFFTQFFKKQTGMTPSKFKEKKGSV